MTNGKQFSLFMFKELESESIQGPYGALALGPNLISWQCSAAVVNFPEALSLSEPAKLSNFNL